ncbi:MAG TPA: dienelactone hydrolase family protein [Acidimicrobiales bacterium]|nr:dienelactone hydrolase family protein [Acidimicrobiales bacterium]
MTLTLSTPDGDMPTYAAGDATTSRAGVVVIQEAFGVTSHIERCADRLAAAGYYAIAPALFHRTTTEAFAYDSFEKLAPHMQALTAAGIETDLSVAGEHLDAAGFGAPTRGIVGFCMGGSVALVAATLGTFGAAVTFYGGGVTSGRFGFPPLVELAPTIRCPWLGCYGDLDKGIPPEDVEALRTAAATAKVTTEVVRYATADHGFNCEDRPAVYNPEAAADAWGRMLAFFARHLSSRN